MDTGELVRQFKLVQEMGDASLPSLRVAEKYRPISETACGSINRKCDLILRHF